MSCVVCRCHGCVQLSYGVDVVVRCVLLLFVAVRCLLGVCNFVVCDVLLVAWRRGRLCVVIAVRCCELLLVVAVVC